MNAYIEHIKSLDVIPYQHQFVRIKIVFEPTLNEHLIYFANAYHFRKILAKAGFIFQERYWIGNIYNMLLLMKDKHFERMVMAMEEKDRKAMIEYVTAYVRDA
jgi:hypothetical protein